MIYVGVQKHAHIYIYTRVFVYVSADYSENHYNTHNARKEDTNSTARYTYDAQKHEQRGHRAMQQTYRTISVGS